MIFYFIFFVFILFFLLISSNDISIKITYFLLFLISAFRYNVGTDYVSYMNIFNHIDNFINKKEIGFVYLIKIISILGGNSQVMFLLMSFLILLFIYKGIRYFYKGNYLYQSIATIIFIPILYFSTLNTIRQMLCVSIFFYSSQFIINRKVFWYFIYISVAVLIHKSAIVLYPLYFILNIKVTRKLILIYILLGIIALLFNPINLLGTVLKTLHISYANYLHSEYFMRESKYSLLLTILSGIVIFSFLPLLNLKDDKANFIANIMMVFVLCRVFSIYGEVLVRISIYFKVFYIIFITNVLFNILYHNNRIKYFLIGLFIFLIICYTYMGIYLRAIKDGSYNQYTFNICLIGEECPINIIGDYNNLYFKD